MRIYNINNYQQNKGYDISFDGTNYFYRGLLNNKKYSKYGKMICESIDTMLESINFPQDRDIDVYIQAEHHYKFKENDRFIPSGDEIVYSAEVLYKKVKSGKIGQSLINFFDIKESAKSLDFVIPEKDISEDGVKRFIGYLTGDRFFSLKNILKNISMSGEA